MIKRLIIELSGGFCLINKPLTTTATESEVFSALKSAGWRVVTLKTDLQGVCLATVYK